jgi:predicted nuclease of predicted toxin-antitoxin system
VAGEIRFHLDECAASVIADGLRRRGIDVTTTPERQLREIDDASQLSFAAAEERVLVTQDADFLHIHRQGVSHSGIVFYVAGSLSMGQILKGLVLIHAVLTRQEMIGHLEFL